MGPGGGQLVLPHQSAGRKIRTGGVVRVEEPDDDIIEIDLRDTYRPRRRKTIGQALDRFIDDTMEAIDPLIQKYAPVVQEVSRVANDPAVQNLLIPSLEAMSRPRPGETTGMFGHSSLFEALFAPPSPEEMEFLQSMTRAFTVNSSAMRGSFLRPSRSSNTTDREENGGQNPRVQRQKITTPFGEMHMMVVSGTSTKNLMDL